MNEHETFADVLAAMRDEGNTGESSCLEWVSAKMRDYADRFEAAHKREIEATAAKCCQLGRLAGYGASEIKHQQDPVGDAAKLREAAQKTNATLEEALEILNGISDEEAGKLNARIEDVADAICEVTQQIIPDALAAPPRNCDRFECATSKTAQEVWRKEDGGKTAYYEWLLATANAAVSIMGRESLSKQCWECASCNRPTAGWGGSKFRCAFLAKDFGTWHYDVPNECPCKGKGWIPKKKEGGDK